MWLSQVQRGWASGSERSGGIGVDVGHVYGLQGCGWCGGERVCCCDERAYFGIVYVWGVVRRERVVDIFGRECEE